MAVGSIANGATTGMWWSRRWAKFMQQVGATADSVPLRGLRIKRLEVQPGVILAQVVERENGATQVEVRFPTLSEVQWSAIIDALGSQAIFVAQLLAGNMPAEIEQIFVDVGSWLLPTNAAEIEQHCAPTGESMAPTTLPCPALIAVYTQLGEMVAEDPWLLLRLRGRDRQQVLATLQEKRNSEAQERSVRSTPATNTSLQEQRAFYTPPFHAAQPGAEQVADLEDRLADFWGRRKILEDAHHHLVRPEVEFALLRRLGPITPNAGDIEAYQQLQNIYRRVTLRAWDLAFSPDAEFEQDDGENGE